MQYLRHESIVGTVARTAIGSVTVPPNMNLLCINLKGTLIVRTPQPSRLVLVPPRSLTFVRPTRLIVQAARGEHHSVFISWPSVATPVLERWLEARNAARGERGGRLVGCKAIDPNLKSAVARFERAVLDGNELLEPQVLSFIYETVSRVMTGPDQVQIAPIPKDLPDTIQELIALVRNNPAQPWPLRDAADRAGYSPFHFSRVFKNMVGYGFHEYVDRCRTECAVDMLCATDSPVDVVASTCGFGTTQGLRESVKDYLGLVPSELRANPDPYDPSD
ncbi:AraC family transcriptional regulator [bacterium]|nr:MAG: AraC family transcriptional regulator [bacterium]